MRILLSNDDGFEAPGLAALREAVDGLGEITVAAPARAQQAAGHSITLTEPLTVRKVRLKCPGEYPAMSIDGRPADCVRLAIRKLLDEPPDLVLTGINAGSNVGVNVFYSGTVAAAAEAAMLGIPAVAISTVTVSKELEAYRPAARLSAWLLGVLLDSGLTSGDLMNVNIPDLSGSPARTVRVVPQSTAELEDVYHVQSRDGEGDRYRLADEYSFTAGREDTDVVGLAEGHVTITPLHVDMTNHDRLAALLRRDWPALPP